MRTTFGSAVAAGAMAAMLSGCAATGTVPATGTPALAPAARPATASQPFSDEFDGTTLNPGWSASSPNPDSTIRLTGNGTLLMRASPKNGGSDLWYSSNYNGPIILQPVSPKLNWTMTVKENFNPTNYFQGAGVLLAYQDGNFDSTAEFIRVAERKDQNVQEVCGYTCTPYSGSVTYFRVVKHGHTYSSAFSADGKQWTSLGSNKVTANYTWIGLDSLRQPWDNDLTVYSNAHYYYFRMKVHPA